MHRRIFGACAAAAACFPASQASTHGFAGARFFPATIQTDDPFVADEMSLPTVTRNPQGADGSQETDIGIDLAKRITPDIGFTFSDQWKYVRPSGASAVHGLDALETGVQYQLFIDAPHEAMALIGLDASWAHTGRVQALGAPDFTTLSPTLDFGKGAGDLPDWLAYLKPLALTGNVGFDFPMKTRSAGVPNPNNFNLGLAVEYSLEYLQHQVNDLGIGAPFDRMIALVEVATTTSLNRGVGGIATGTIAPGIIWAGQHYQIGAEALIPFGNSAQGRGIGGVLQFHLFLDDLFPDSIGKPLLGR
jgi:hypothetical protein